MYSLRVFLFLSQPGVYPTAIQNRLVRLYAAVVPVDFLIKLVDSPFRK